MRLSYLKLLKLHQGENTWDNYEKALWDKGIAWTEITVKNILFLPSWKIQKLWCNCIVRWNDNVIDDRVQ